MSDKKTVEHLRSRAPGTDPEDPYESRDIDTLPNWWQRAIEEFESHDLRPYRPPKFEDGKLVHKVVSNIEQMFEVNIQFGSTDTDYRKHWTVRIDGEPVTTIGRHRSVEGYTVYEIDHTEFVSLMQEVIPSVTGH